MKQFKIIACLDRNMGIGREGRLPWHLPEDLEYFHRITSKASSPEKQNAVIMGRKTWESLPEEVKPMKGRINVVISSNPDFDFPDGVLQFESLDHALMAINTSEKIDKVFVIGGGKLYAEAILHPQLEQIFLTRLEEDYDCDVFFPEKIPAEFEIVSTTEIMESDGLEFYMVILEKTDGEPAETDEEFTID